MKENFKLTKDDLDLIRKGHSFSKDEFAGLLGYSRQYIHRIETGVQVMTEQFKNKLYEKFELTDEKVIKIREFIYEMQNPHLANDAQRYKPAK